MDFVHDQLADGRKLRTLTVVDLFTRKCLAIEMGFSLRAEHVVAAMRQISHERGLPRCQGDSPVTTDRSSQAGTWIFWAYANHVQIDFKRRGKPTDNATVESFNGKFRDECLNEH